MKLTLEIGQKTLWPRIFKLFNEIVDDHKSINFVSRKEKLMLLKADAFGSDKWSVRISLANLATNQYSEVGKRMIRLSEHIKEEWLRQKRRN